ncbi:MAG: hypothetical protein U1F77_12630 [Kiritimatiellia bacterium]
MDAPIQIRIGLCIRLAGAPARGSPMPPMSGKSPSPRRFPGDEAPPPGQQEGQPVKRGTALLQDKKHESILVTAPSAGTVKQVVYGARRAIEGIVIDVASADVAESFPTFTEESVLKASREEIVGILGSGLIRSPAPAAIFRIPSPSATPKAVFVNAMATAPAPGGRGHGRPGARAGIPDRTDALKQCGRQGRLSLHREGMPRCPVSRTPRFGILGPSSGNTSTHIHKLCPIWRPATRSGRSPRRTPCGSANCC